MKDELWISNLMVYVVFRVDELRSYFIGWF